MCGICGVVAFGQTEAVPDGLIENLTRTLAHRGPDDEGFVRAPGYALGFRRLSIIDLSANGNQPFHNETHDVFALCNGEIYNFRSLRDELIRAGHAFRSAGDCEVCVHAYEQYGDSFLQRLHGMFALAILDVPRRRLLLARDRLGIKPLYYSYDPHGIRFGSELKAIVADPRVPKQIDSLALNLYFVKDVIPAPHTIYKGIFQMEPAEMLVADLDRGSAGIRKTKYWQPDLSPDNSLDEDSVVARLMPLLEDAVDSHLVSDVPVGIFLSGGLDSSTVLALARRKTDTPPATFTIGLDDTENDESEVARRLAALWSASHHTLRLERERVVEALGKIVGCFDEPFGDPSAVPTYDVSRLARRNVKVVLSGDGGDELFSGYISRRGTRNLAAAGSLPEWLRTFPAALLSRVAPAISIKRLALPTWLMLASLWHHVFDRHCREILRPEWRVSDEELFAGYEPLRETLSRLDPVSAYLAAVLKQYLPDDILTKVDRASSAHGLETRVPLLDHRLVEFAVRIPPALKFKKDVHKYILQRTIGGLLPDFVLRHEKRGFGIPAAYWQDSLWRDRLVELRRICPPVGDILNFSEMETWNGRLLWRALFLAEWIYRRPA